MRSGKYYKKIIVNGKAIDEHRYKMQQKLGRKLGFNEIVHHADEDINNNDESNLKVITRANHGRLHAESRVYGDDFKKKMREIGIQTMPNKKLSVDEVLEIRKLSKSGAQVKQLQVKFSIARRTVYDIISYTTWKHIA